MNEPELIRWSFNNIIIPMIKCPDGVLRCTGVAVCKALGVSPTALLMLRRKYPEQLKPLSISGAYAKDFVLAHKELFDLKRVRGDILLWGTRELITVAHYCLSKTALAFTHAIVDLVEEHAKKSTISRDEYIALIRRVVTVENAKRAMGIAASAAGVALRAQRGTRPLRTQSQLLN